MSRSASLTVIVPDILLGPGERQSNPSSRATLLARIAGRGDLVHAWPATTADTARLQAWQRGLLASVSLEEQEHASAPVSACGLGLPTTGRHWLHAEPVHFAAGLNDVTLVPLRGALALTAEELDGLTFVLDAHFTASGLRLHRASRGWLLESSAQWDLQTVIADFARSHEWIEGLPQGGDAGNVRRLMTEAQMLLHDHAVNQRRSALGLPTANALWLWGNGSGRAEPRTNSVVCVGGHEYLRGLCALHGWAAPRPANSAAELLAHADTDAQIVAVVECEHAVLEEQWLKPLVEGLRGGVIDKFELVIDEWRVTLDRWRWRRFWRRDLPVSEWVDA